MDELTVIPQFQRSIRDSKVKTMAKNFNELYMGDFIVAKMTDRKNNTVYHICDGQHRYMALLDAIKKYGRADLSHIKVPCHIYEGLSEKEIRSICKVCNKVRASISANELYRFSLQDGDEKETCIDNLLSSFGFSSLKKENLLSDKDVEPWNIIEGNTLLRWYRRNSSDPIPYISMALTILRDCWDKEPERVSKFAVHGMIGFFKMYSDSIIQAGISKEELEDIFSRFIISKLPDLMSQIYLYANINTDKPDINKIRLARVAFLSILYMAYDYNMARVFMPSTQTGGGHNGHRSESDATIISRTLMANTRNKPCLNKKEFMKNTRAVKKYPREPKNGFGAEFFK